MRAVFVGVIGFVMTAVLLRDARKRAVVERLGSGRAPKLSLPPALARRVERALDAAALDVDVSSALQLWLAVAVGVGVVTGTAFGGLVAGLAAVGVVALGGPAAMFAARYRRDRMLTREVPVTIERIASELRAGGTVRTAIVALAQGDARLADDFARMSARCDLGAPVADSLRAWSRERTVPGVDVAAGALAMCTSIGGRAADALDGLATSLRDRSALVAEAHALSAQARMSAYVVGGTPLLYLAWSAIVDHDAMHAVVGTSVGRVCLLVGCSLEVVGAWWMRRILRAGSVL